MKQWSLDARSREPTRLPLERDEEREITRSVSAFLLPFTASVSSSPRQTRLETLFARRVGEPRTKLLVIVAHPFHPRLEEE